MDKFIGLDLLQEKQVFYSKTPFKFGDNIIGYPVNIEQLIEKIGKEIIPEKLGIYHLFYDDVLIYIGMSIDLRSRLLGHYKRQDIEFNNVLWFCTEECGKTKPQTFKIESTMIKYYKPFYNKACLT